MAAVLARVRSPLKSGHYDLSDIEPQSALFHLTDEGALPVHASVFRRNTAKITYWIKRFRVSYFLL